MGSFYAAQFYMKAQQAIPTLETDFKKGETNQLMHWLQTNIYKHGRTLTSEELCKSVCGEGLNIHYFLAYLLAKYKNIYNF
jgi:carboxypeptidase Taq